jgi:Undecaprenyl-phosphate glucose phosphotransferase
VPSNPRRLRRRRVPISWSLVSGIWVLLDSIAILGSGAACYMVYVGWSDASSGYYAGAIFFIWVAAIVFSQFAGLTEADAVLSPFQVLDRIFIVGITCFFFLLAIAFSLKVSDYYSRIWVYAFGTTTAVSVVGFRLCGALIIRSLTRSGLLRRRVAIFGASQQAERFLAKFENGAKGLSQIVGAFDDRLSRVGDDIGGVSVRGNFKDLVALIRRGEVDDVVLAMPWDAEDYISDVVTHLQELPVNIYLAFDLVAYRYRFRRSPNHFAGLDLVEVVDAPLSGWKFVLKTAEDRILAFMFLGMLAPFLLLIYLAVRIETPGPVFFKQRRFGFNNEKFVIYKCRTMRHEEEQSSHTVQATPNDPRVTRVGRFLRRTSLDELPQLLNVLNGTMSLVGPRPHAVDHNEEYSKQIRGYFARHNMKPGITGFAQVNGLRGETDTIQKMKERVRDDIHYTEHWSLWLDLQILLKTIFIVVIGKNAY